MHEVGIMQSVLALAEEQARGAGAVQIHEVRLRIGRLAGVVTEALQTAFEVLRPGTLAAEASLAIDEVAAACWCGGCQAEFAAEEWIEACPRCGAVSVQLRRGRELELASLEIS
jgi:hydrogenase nickel incorporation protein HypA/HybF